MLAFHSGSQLEVRPHFRFDLLRRLLASVDRRPGKQATDCRLCCHCGRLGGVDWLTYTC
jgi:hypothetical protein